MDKHEVEYIEREALIREFGDEPEVWTDSESELQERCDWYKYLSIVEAQGAADVVPVVRCAECAVPHNKMTGCPKLNGLVTPPDFYCPFGERRTDGNS